MTAQKLRMIMAFGLGLWVVVAGVVFWLFHGQLSTYAADVSKITAEASLSSENIATLQRLENKLEEDRISVDRAKNIVAESKQYVYQDQIIDDLNAYARASGVGIGSYTFTDGNSTGQAATGGAAAPAPAAETGGTEAAPEGTEQAAPADAGLRTTSVSITLRDEASYESVMKFIRSIEQNLTKMQLAGVTLSKSAESNNIVANTLTIEVYIR